MLEQILKLYWMAMAGDVRSPLPHLFGPPGCGKSTSVEQAAELLGVNLHIINVSRISPLELEGVQMPMSVTVDGSEGMHLKMLTATFWTQLKEGDILLLDEFLRGFPEVYNGLLDILTSRRVGGYELPKVFIIGASNSTVAYDKALEDRLLHLPVPDPRKKKSVKKGFAELVVNELGLLPQMAESMEMQQLLDVEVMPMFDILDTIGKGNNSSPVTVKGSSLRNLIGQARLREIHSTELKELLNMNNVLCKQQSKHQFMVLPDAKVADAIVYDKLLQLKGNPKLTDTQRLNIELNLQLIEMENEKKEGSETPDDVFLDDLG